MRVNAKIQVSDLFFTIGETASGFFGGTITIGEFGNHNYGSSGYYLIIIEKRILRKLIMLALLWNYIFLDLIKKILPCL